MNYLEVKKKYKPIIETKKMLKSISEKETLLFIQHSEII